MKARIRKGTKVVVLDDTRGGKPAVGKKGKIVGFEKLYYGYFFAADGSLITDKETIRRNTENIETLVEWNPDAERFPGQECYMTIPHVTIELEDGGYVSSRTVVSVPLNPRVRTRLLRQFEEILEKSGCPEEEKQKLLEAWRQLEFAVKSLKTS